jgi:nitroimidazol reductase NimA-like FMN-containing flavoprotein (pyridoxamine 5'-phosphate oxidase superfamily)
MSATITEPKKTSALTAVELQQTAVEYIRQTKWATLATVREDGAPVLRTMGSFAPDGVNVYFSTPKKAGKVRHIAGHPLVNFFFQHENQELDTFKNVAIIGPAEEVTAGTDYQRGIELLSNRNPRFKARADRGELADTAIYLIRTREIKYLDYANRAGGTAIQEIKL